MNGHGQWNEKVENIEMQNIFLKGKRLNDVDVQSVLVILVQGSLVDDIQALRIYKRVNGLQAFIAGIK